MLSLKAYILRNLLKRNGKITRISDIFNNIVVTDVRASKQAMVVINETNPYPAGREKAKPNRKN
jgi:hypothetical protein